MLSNPTVKSRLQSFDVRASFMNFPYSCSARSQNKLDIVKALQMHASALTELSKIRRAIVALSGPTAKRRIGKKGGRDRSVVSGKIGSSGSHKRTASTRKLSVRMKRVGRRKAGK